MYVCVDIVTDLHGNYSTYSKYNQVYDMIWDESVRIFNALIRNVCNFVEVLKNGSLHHNQQSDNF